MSIERRDYFRVDTSLLMGWRPVSMDPTEEDPLLEINQQIGKAITDSAAEQPTLSQFMSLLNNKIDAVRDELSVSENRRRKRRVNISGSGIAFTTTRPADRGSEIEVSLVLPTTNTPVSVSAEVVGRKRIPQERESPSSIASGPATRTGRTLSPSRSSTSCQKFSNKSWPSADT